MKGIEMLKTYTVAGLATDKNGKTSVRYANDLHKRLAILKRDGFTNLNFIHVGEPETKKDLCEIMLGLVQFQNDKQIIMDEMNNVTTRLNKISRKATLYGNMTPEQLLEALK